MTEITSGKHVTFAMQELVKEVVANSLENVAASILDTRNDMEDGPIGEAFFALYEGLTAEVSTLRGEDEDDEDNEDED